MVSAYLSDGVKQNYKKIVDDKKMGTSVVFIQHRPNGL
jgi:hypothetical protein